MALFDWLKRLFRHTAESPPPASPSHPPLGLDRPDPPELLAAWPAPPHAQAPATGGQAPPGREAPSANDSAAPGRQRRPRRESAGFGETLGEDVYGLTFGIEYEAASGDFSRRRIMLQAISIRDDGAVFLRALCFERNALRSFRLDRVQCVIDGDGVVFEDPAAFFRDELRLDLRAAAMPSAPKPDQAGSSADAPAMATQKQPNQAAPGGAMAAPTALADDAGMAQRRAARDGLRVLAALGRSDGLLHRAEVEVILDYIEAHCRQAGVPCDTGDRAALAPYLKRQRQALDVVEGCLSRLEADPAAAALLLTYAERLILADGKEHAAERALFAKLGASVAGLSPAAPSQA